MVWKRDIRKIRQMIAVVRACEERQMEEWMVDEMEIPKRRPVGRPRKT